MNINGHHGSTSHVGEDPISILSKWILMMGRDATKRKGLATTFAMLNPLVSGEHPIVPMIVLDSNAMVCGKGFKGKLAKDSFVGRGGPV